MSNFNRFYEIVNIVTENINELVPNDQITVEEIDLQKKAVKGDKNAESICVSRIEEILNKNQLLETNYPYFFESLSQAVFHEIYRFGVFHKWFKCTDSFLAEIKGMDMWFEINNKMIKQDEQFKDENYIYRIIRCLKVINKDFNELNINDSKNRELNISTELNINDQVKCAVITPPNLEPPIIRFEKIER